MRRIGSDEGLDAQRKAYLMQNIMASRYIVAQQKRMRGRNSSGGGATAAAAAAAGGALAPGRHHTYHDSGHRILGCAHYKRGCAPGQPA